MKNIKTDHQAVKNKNKIIYFLILIVVFLVSYAKIFDTKLDLNGDNFSYLILAENITNGHGYSKQSVDGTYKPASWFPPGYPYLLAISNSIVNSVKGLKILNGLIFLAAILLFFSMVKNMTRNPPFAFSISVLLVLNSGLLRLSTMIMSEIPYLFFSLLAFYSVLKVDEKGKKEDFWKSRFFYLSIISSILALYMRGFGMVLIGAIAVHWLSQRKWKLTGAYLLGNIILYSPYQIRNMIYDLKGRYLKTILVDNPWRPESGEISSLAKFWDKIVTNLNDTVINGFPQVLFPAISSSEATSSIKLFGVFILLIAFWGIWRLKNFRYLFGSYIIFNIGIFLLWHTGNGVRYVWPLTGFISFAFFYGLLEIIKNSLLKHTQLKNLKFIGFSFLLISFFLFPKIKELEKNKKYDHPPAYKNYFSIAKSLNKKTNNEKLVVICRKPNMFAYFSNCLTSNYKYSLNDKAVIQHMVDINTDYIVLEQLNYSSTKRYLFPAIQKNQHLFKPVLHLKKPDTYLLYFDKEKAKEILK